MSDAAGRQNDTPAVEAETQEAPSRDEYPPVDHLEPITYPTHLVHSQPSILGQPTPSHPKDNVSPINSTQRQRDFTLGSGATTLLEAVHHKPVDSGAAASGPDVTASSMETTSVRLRVSIPTPPQTDTAESARETLPLTAISTTAQNVVPELDGNPPMVVRDAGDIQPVEGPSIMSTEMPHESKDTLSRRRRGPTRSVPKNYVAPPESDETVREKDRNRKSSSKTTRMASRTASRPQLPQSRGVVSRAPTSAMYFSPLPTYGCPPDQPLRAHTGTLVGDRIWFLGGVDGKNCWRRVAWFDTESLLWSTIETFGERLPPLRAHTTTLVGHNLYIFGGGDGPAYSNEVWILDTSKCRRTNRADVV